MIRLIKIEIYISKRIGGVEYEKQVNSTHSHLSFNQDGIQREFLLYGQALFFSRDEAVGSWNSSWVLTWSCIFSYVNRKKTTTNQNLDVSRIVCYFYHYRASSSSIVIHKQEPESPFIPSNSFCSNYSTYRIIIKNLKHRSNPYNSSCKIGNTVSLSV